MAAVKECCCLSWAVIKIGCFTCCRRLVGAQPPNQRPEFDIICLGLHEAGKSSLLALVSNEDTDELPPTGGFAIKAVALSNVVFSVKEVGGTDGVRPYWHRYFADNQGLVFVVDASSSVDELVKAVTALKKAALDPQLEGLPLLLLLNKVDLDDVVHLDEVVKHVDPAVTKGRHVVMREVSLSDREATVRAFEDFAAFYTDDAGEES